MPTASQNVAAEDDRRPIWPPSQDRAAAHPPRLVTFPRGMRKFDFGVGVTAAQAARAQADCDDAPSPTSEAVDPQLFRRATQPAVKGGTIPKAQRRGLSDDHTMAPGLYDYRHLYAIACCQNRFFIPHSPRAAAAPIVAPAAAATATRAASPKRGTPRRCSTVKPARSARDAAAPLAGVHVGKKRSAGKHATDTPRGNGASQNAPEGQPLLESDEATPRHAQGRAAAQDSASRRPLTARPPNAAIDDCIRRHIGGSTFGAPRHSRNVRLGADVNLHLAAKTPGPGTYRIRSTFDRVHIVQTTRGCINAHLC